MFYHILYKSIISGVITMYKKTNSFSPLFHSLEVHRKIYTYGILKKLILKSEQGSNLEELYLIFKNRKKKLVKNIISELDDKLMIYKKEKCVGYIICKKEKCVRREQRYFITKEGNEFLYEHLDK